MAACDHKRLLQALFPELYDIHFTPKELRDARTIRLRQVAVQPLGRWPFRRDVAAAVQLSDKDQTELLRALEPYALKSLPRYMAAVNRIIDVYCASGSTRYAVDVSKYGKDSEEFDMLVSNMRSLRLSPDSSDFTPCDAFDFAIELLAYNDCFDAISFPNLWEQENAKAAERARTVDWDKYAYAAILVPGQGPEFYGIKVSPLAQLKMRMAVAELQKDRAPFVVVSGGTVHPPHTAVNEAVEMGIWLNEKLNLDRSQVVLEPHSRHTTTNLRNTARVVKKLGAPEGKPILIVAGEEQIRDILGPMQRRAQVELTHVLGTITPGSTSFTAVYIPSSLCEIVDPMDPRDP